METYGQWKLKKLIDHSEQIREQHINELAFQNNLTAARNASSGRRIQRENPMFAQLGSNLSQLLVTIATENPNLAKRLVYRMIAALKGTETMQSASTINQIKMQILRQLGTVEAPTAPTEPMQ